MKKTLSLLTLLIMSTSLMACNRGLDLGPSEDTKVSELSDAEAQEACDNLEAYYNDQIPEEEQKRVACTTAGLLAAAFTGASTDEELQSACAEARDQCLMGEVTEEGGESTCSFKDSSCMATVGDVEVCLEASVQATADAFAEIKCENLTVSTMEEMEEETQEIAECASLDAQCPRG